MAFHLNPSFLFHGTYFFKLIISFPPYYGPVSRSPRQTMTKCFLGAQAPFFTSNNLAVRLGSASALETGHHLRTGINFYVKSEPGGLTGDLPEYRQYTSLGPGTAGAGAPLIPGFLFYISLPYITRSRFFLPSDGKIKIILHEGWAAGACRPFRVGPPQTIRGNPKGLCRAGLWANPASN